MNCERAKGLLPALLDAALPAGELGEVKAHVSACEHCARELAALKKANALVKGLPEVEPPPFFAKKVMARVKAETAAKPGLLQRLFLPLHVKLPLEALAAVFVAVLAIQIYRSYGPELPAPALLPPPPAIERRDAAAKMAQVERKEEVSKKKELVPREAAPVAEEPAAFADGAPAFDKPAKSAKEKAPPPRAVATPQKEGWSRAAPGPRMEEHKPAEALGARFARKKEAEKRGKDEGEFIDDRRATGGTAGVASAEKREEKREKMEMSPRAGAGFAPPPPRPAAEFPVADPAAPAARPAERQVTAAGPSPKMEEEERAPAAPRAQTEVVGADEAFAAERLAPEKAERAMPPPTAKRFSAPTATAPPPPAAGKGYQAGPTYAPAEEDAKSKADRPRAQKLVVRTENRSDAAGKLQEIISSLNARLIRKQVRADRDVFFIEIPARNLDAFVSRLKPLGEVAGTAEPGDEAENVELRVEILDKAR